MRTWRGVDLSALRSEDLPTVGDRSWCDAAFGDPSETTDFARLRDELSVGPRASPVLLPVNGRGIREVCKGESGVPKPSLVAKLLVVDANVEADKVSEAEYCGVPGMFTESCGFEDFVLGLVIALAVCAFDPTRSLLVFKVTTSAMSSPLGTFVLNF